MESKSHAVFTAVSGGRERVLLLFAVFFLICLGLGYPTLNRYNPRIVLPDSAVYARLVAAGPGAVDGHFRYRILVPTLVRPLYRLAEGRVKTWDPMMLGFLLVNSLFVAGTAMMLVHIGTRLTDYRTALAGAMLYLLNFATANVRLAGLVDSGEGFFLMAFVASLFFERWWLLPLWGILGALTKESFVPFSLVLACTWWAISEKSEAQRTRTGIWLSMAAIAEFATIVILWSSISSHLMLPWTFASQLNSHSNYALNLLASLIDRNNWYILIWLLPLGLIRIRQFPGPWVWASTAASLSVLILNAYHAGTPGGVGRAVFSVAGPLLSLGAAEFLCRPAEMRVKSS